MKFNIKVSVIIPCYNSELYISECVYSVLNQSYTNIEVIVVDDCSTDNSYFVLQNIQSIDNRLKILRNNFNSGVSFARNLGIQNSTGEYICFLDSDDFWNFDKIEKQLSYMIENNYNLTYTYYTVFHANSFKLINNLNEIVNYKKLLKGNCIGLSTTMLKKNCIDDITFKNIGHEDFLFWLHFLKKNDQAFLLKVNSTFYRIHNKSLSHNKFKAVTYSWNIYRNELKFNLIFSFYYICSNILNAIIKRIF